MSSSQTSISIYLTRFEAICRAAYDDMRVLAARFSVMQASGKPSTSTPAEKAALDSFRRKAVALGEIKDFLKREALPKPSGEWGYGYSSLFFTSMCFHVIAGRRQSPTDGERSFGQFEKFRKPDLARYGFWARLSGEAWKETDDEAAADYIGQIACEMGLQESNDIETWIRECARKSELRMVSNVAHVLALPHANAVYGHDYYHPSSDEFKKRISPEDRSYVRAYPDRAVARGMQPDEVEVVSLIRSDAVQRELSLDRGTGHETWMSADTALHGLSYDRG